MASSEFKTELKERKRESSQCDQCPWYDNRLAVSKSPTGFCFCPVWMNPQKYPPIVLSIQECIPVGCVPAARWPYAVVCFPVGGGVSSLVVVVVLGGGVGSGGCLLQGGLLWGGVCSGGCLLPGGGWYPSMHWGRHPSLWTDSHTPVKTLPWPNFVAADKNRFFFGESTFDVRSNWENLMKVSPLYGFAS